MADIDNHPLISWERQDGYVVFTPKKLIGTDDAIAWIDCFFPAHPVEHVVWDLRHTSLSDIPTTDYHRLIAEADKYAEARGPDPQTAILVEGQFDQMVVTVFLTFAEIKSKIEFCMVTDMDAARAWFKE